MRWVVPCNRQRKDDGVGSNCGSETSCVRRTAMTRCQSRGPKVFQRRRRHCCQDVFPRDPQLLHRRLRLPCCLNRKHSLEHPYHHLKTTLTSHSPEKIASPHVHLMQLLTPLPMLNAELSAAYLLCLCLHVCPTRQDSPPHRPQELVPLPCLLPRHLPQKAPFPPDHRPWHLDLLQVLLQLPCLLQGRLLLKAQCPPGHWR
mmetsp:Transcript_28102/g.74591  ORF Transcript_28102/g.74591 Transcript_28102/m.74591 type:complete len:201 (-) Transcript_28102:88-690(-)